MIDLYTWATPNGHKVHIMLEETGLDYTVHGINIRAGDQFEDDFLRISPNNRIPAIVDRDGPGGKELSLFETGAILIYLGDKTGQFMPGLEDDAHGRYNVMQWLMWQMGGVGPNFGQAFHFLHQHPEDVPDETIEYGRSRYGAEVTRLCNVMNARLAEAAFLAGDDYSVADIATYPWVALHKWFDLDLAALPHLRRWYDEIKTRPAIRRGMDVPTRDQIEHHANDHKGEKR